MAEDNYNTSQSNLNADLQQQQSQQQQQQQPAQQGQLRRQRSQQSSEQLVPGGGGPTRTTRIADEMSQDLQYLSREAPLDGGESTFGAYSTLGGGSQPQQGTDRTVVHQTAYKSTVTTRTSTASPLGDDDGGLLLDDSDDQQGAARRRMKSDYERTDFRIDGDDDATQVYDYNQQMNAAAASGRDTQSPFGDPQQLEQLAPDNVDIQRPLQQAGFLVSFMVDARGGAMRGCRHSGVRVIIPPSSAPQPMRITCRYLRRERLIHPPPLMEGEACASKIMEVGPAGARFLGPVLIEVPHFASLRGKEREIIILRSDSGEVWREHLFDTDEQLIDSIIRSAEMVDQQQNSNTASDQENQRPSSAIGQDVGGGGDSNLQQEKRLTRIVTNEFPQYFAIISRIRQEVHSVGPEGLAVNSQVVPKVQAIFTDGALTKRIKIGLQKKNGSRSPGATPEPNQTPAAASGAHLEETTAATQSEQERARSPSGGRPGSAQAKRKNRFLACFGASHGSHDLLDQSGTDAEGFASGSNESSTSSAGGNSPRQLANERLVERRHIIEDLTDSEADSNSLQGDGAAKTKSNSAATKSKLVVRRSATGNELVPDDYYMEQEPAFILNVRPKTYGKRLASSSAQTDQKLQMNGFLSTSTKSQKRRGVNLLAKRRRNKTQMQIPSHEPTMAQQKSNQQSRLRPRSADFGAPATDSSLESHQQATEGQQQHHLMNSSLGDSMLPQEEEEINQKWRTCTIQTDSDSVTVQYVTISSLADAGSGAGTGAATATTKTTATTTGHDDGYVSGSGELKRNAADQTASKTGHKTGLLLPFCASSGTVEDDDDDGARPGKTAADGSWLDDQQEDGKRDRKRKKTAAKEKKGKKTSGGSGKLSPVRLDAVPEATKAEQQQQQAVVVSDDVDVKKPNTPLVTDSSIDAATGSLADQSGAAQLSGAEEADESLLTTTTSRSISPTSKELKQQLKLEKQEKLKREKFERQKQKELEEANAKAAKAQKKLEKEAKKKAEKLAKKAATSSGSKQSPSESRAQSPELGAAAAASNKQDGGGVLGVITKTIQSVKFAPSPSKDSVDDKSTTATSQLDDSQQVDESRMTTADSSSNSMSKSDDRVADDEEDNSMVHVSIGADSTTLLTDQAKCDQTLQQGPLDQDHDHGEMLNDESSGQQLISFSLSETETQSASAVARPSSEQATTKVPLKPILKQQSSSIEETQQQACATAEVKIEEPKNLASIADELISEATEEAVRAADSLQRAQHFPTSGTSSPTLTGSLSESKSEAAKRLKAEREKLKADIKLSLSEEKRLTKEAKRMAKQAEEAAKRAEHEAKKAAQEAREEAERQAEIAKKEAEEALKLIEATSQEATTITRATIETETESGVKEPTQLAAAGGGGGDEKKRAKQAEAEAKRIAKAAEEEAKRAVKEAEAEAKRQAKEAKAEAERLAKEEKARLKAEKKKNKGKGKGKKDQSGGVEPSAPSLDLVSSYADDEDETSKSSPSKGPIETAAPSDNDSKSVPIGLPRVSFELEQRAAGGHAGEPEAPASVKPAGDVVPKDDGDVEQQQPDTTEKASPTVDEKSEASESKKDQVSSSSKKKKEEEEEEKTKKKRKIGKRDTTATTSLVSSATSKDESSATEPVSKSSFLGRLFRLKPKQKQPSEGAEMAAAAVGGNSTGEAAVKLQDEQQKQQQMIVSEMYPSDPNNADGEMILEVNVPEDLISETRRARRVGSQDGLPDEKVASAVTSSIVTSTTGQQVAEPTDDQEATLVNLSQMVDDVNDEDDDEATENVLSQANEFVESHVSSGQADTSQVAHNEQPVALMQDQSLQDSEQPVKSSASAQNMAAQQVEVDTQKSTFDAPERTTSSERAPAPAGFVQTELVEHQEEASAAQQHQQQEPQASRVDLGKDEKSKKELEVKLEKEAKKRAKEEEKLRKKREKEDKKRAEMEAKKQAKEEKERLKREAKEAKKLAELAKKEASKNKRKGKVESTESTGAAAAESQDPNTPQGEPASNQEQQQPTTITTTTITSSTTTCGDDSTLNPNIGDEIGAARVLMSSSSEVPINEETEVEQIVEEVVGDDGTVTKTTKTIETKYVTMRQEEVRVAELRDIPAEEWERIQAERAEQQAKPSTSDGQFIERFEQSRASPQVVLSPELEKIRIAPSYCNLSQPLAEIKLETTEKKALKKRIKLNQKLIKRAYKLAKSESKKAKRDQLRAEAEIAVCDEAARQARKELKRAVKEAKRAAKQTEQQHKKMDKIDKKLAKRAKELEKRQKKIDKKLAKAAKKQAKKDDKAAAKAAKSQRKASSSSSSSSSKSPSRGSKRSIKAEDIGEPVLRSSSRLSIVQNNPNVELSPRQQLVDVGAVHKHGDSAQAAPAAAGSSPTGPAAVGSASEQAQVVDVGQQLENSGAPSQHDASQQQQPDLSQDQIEQMVGDGEYQVVHTITRETLVEHGDGSGAPHVERQEETRVLTGAEAEAAVMRMELEAARDEDEEMMIDVVGDGDGETKEARDESGSSPETNPAEQQAEKENVANGNKSPETTPSKKKNKKKNKRQKSKESSAAAE